jgi:hypothetical protein
MIFLPLKSLSEISDKSVLVTVKAGAWLPTLGNVPIVFIGFPCEVIFVIAYAPFCASILQFDLLAHYQFLYYP